MLLHKKFTQKPLYKKLFRLRVNLFRKDRVLLFNRKKWSPFKKFYLKSYIYNRFRYKSKAAARFTVTKDAYTWCGYKKRYKNTLLEALKFRLYYGGFKKKYFKQQIRKVKATFKQEIRESKRFPDRISKPSTQKLTWLFLQLFERRLDTVLYRSRFAFSVKSARQFILHGKVRVNGRVVKSKGYLLYEGDLVEIVPSYSNLNTVFKSLKRSLLWPIPPQHLLINYRTVQILFGHMKNTNMSLCFDTLEWYLHKLTLFYLKH